MSSKRRVLVEVLKGVQEYVDIEDVIDSRTFEEVGY
jgi:hypothetical protein